MVIAAQLSTGHSPAESLEINLVMERLRKAALIRKLDCLIVGPKEFANLFQALSAEGSRPTDQVFLWYPLLSDYPGLEPDHLIINYKGVPSRGWGGSDGDDDLAETFRFACPNNPTAQDATLAELERLLLTYNFDGLFLDKFRYPSPANGLDEVLSCFCAYCRKAAADFGFDLDEVQHILVDPPVHQTLAQLNSQSPSHWLDDLLGDRPLLQAFIAFRAGSISRMVSRVQTLTQRLGVELALDLFSPCLAMLVGQDYRWLSGLASWAKPMTYRLALGPAGLRLEIPALVSDIGHRIGSHPDEVWRWIERREPGLAGTTNRSVIDTGVPLAFIADEILRAIDLLSPAPVFLGLETVSIPGVIDIKPEDVNQMVTLGLDLGVSGFVLSWDIMNTLLQNLEPLRLVR